MQRLEEQFRLFDDGLPASADGPDAIEGGYYMCQQLNAHMEAGSYWIGRRPHNKKECDKPLNMKIYGLFGSRGNDNPHL